MEFVTTARGGHKMTYDGFSYVKQKTLTDGAVWYECELRRCGALCKTRVKVRAREIISTTNAHTHGPELKVQNVTPKKRKARLEADVAPSGDLDPEAGNEEEGQGDIESPPVKKARKRKAKPRAKASDD